MYNFREITEADNAVVAALVRDNLRQFNLDIPGTAYFDEGLDHLSDYYGTDECRYYVLENDAGIAIGGIGFSRFGEALETAELQKLYLADSEKGKSLGYRMIDFIEDRMREAGFTTSYLETHDNLQAAIHIYVEKGYEEIERPEEVGHSTMNRFFRKKLMNIIETERLILRPFKESDAEDVYEYLKEPAVNCFADMKLHSLDEARDEMKNRIGETEFYFAITLKDSGKVIGEIDAYPETGEPHADENSPKDTFSPCWMLNKDYQGKGYAYEAAKAFFDYLFKEKGARRIYAYTEDYNISSQHLCEKLGMRKEGLFKEFVSFVNNPDGTPRYENTLQYAILSKEWNGYLPVKTAINNFTN